MSGTETTPVFHEAELPDPSTEQPGVAATTIDSGEPARPDYRIFDAVSGDEVQLNDGAPRIPAPRAPEAPLEEASEPTVEPEATQDAAEVLTNDEEARHADDASEADGEAEPVTTDMDEQPRGDLPEVDNADGIPEDPFAPDVAVVETDAADLEDGMEDPLSPNDSERSDDPARDLEEAELAAAGLLAATQSSTESGRHRRPHGRALGVLERNHKKAILIGALVGAAVVAAATWHWTDAANILSSAWNAITDAGERDAVLSSIRDHHNDVPLPNPGPVAPPPVEATTYTTALDAWTGGYDAVTQSDQGSLQDAMVQLAQNAGLDLQPGTPEFTDFAVARLRESLTPEMLGGVDPQTATPEQLLAAANHLPTGLQFSVTVPNA